MPRLAILWHLSAVPPGNYSFDEIARAVKETNQATGTVMFKAYAAGLDRLNAFEADQIRAELGNQGADLRSFAHSTFSDLQIEREIVCDLLSFTLGCSATERVGRPTVILIVPDPEPYLGPIKVLRSNKFKVTLILGRSQVFAFADHADQTIVWDQLMRDARSAPAAAPSPSPLPAPQGAVASPTQLPPVPFAVSQPAQPGGSSTRQSAAAASPAAAVHDWEAELDALLKGITLQTPAPAPAAAEVAPDTSDGSPEVSRSRGFVWDVTEDEVGQRKASAVGTPEWHARLDLATPPQSRSEVGGSSVRPDRGGDANEFASGAAGGGGGGWDDALSAIARQTHSPVCLDQSHSDSALGLEDPLAPPATDWLDTLLNETASLAPSESASDVAPGATPVSNGTSPGPASPWITVTRGIKTAAAYEEEKQQLFGPLVDAVRSLSEQTGARRVNRGLVGSALASSQKAKARFYGGLPQGIDTFRDYTRAAEKAGVIILRNSGDRDGLIELAPQRQHAKAQSLPVGIGGKDVPGLGVSWRAAGKIARGGAR